MNYILIVGVIVLIALIAYLVMSKKQGIKEGKYGSKGEDGKNTRYIIVSKDSVELGGYAGNLPRKDTETKLIKSGMTFKVDENKVPVFEASVPVNKTLYFAQSLKDDSIFMLFKDPNGSLIKFPITFVPTQTL